MQLKFNAHVIQFSLCCLLLLGNYILSAILFCFFFGAYSLQALDLKFVEGQHESLSIKSASELKKD